ncbi:MAG: hypothetical protein K2N05_12825 [Muribaculaceae bacterium]|nr:hypothetical protein [Muribaculaceae bacterium]
MKKLFTIYFVLLTIINFPLSAQNKLIVENRIWEYFNYKGEDRWYELYMFDGTCELNGKTYNQWKLIKRTDLPSSSDAAPMETPMDSVVALMREEAGKVYLLLQDQTIRRYNSETKMLSAPFVAPEGEEAILYDFTLSADDNVTEPVKLLWAEELPAQTAITQCNVVGVRPFDLNDMVVNQFTLESDLHIQILKNLPNPDEAMDKEIHLSGDEIKEGNVEGIATVTYAEVIGNSGRGNMTSLMPQYPIYLTSGFMDYEVCYLSSVFDVDGTYIYGKPAGIHNTQITKQDNDSRLYDLHGRRVTNPQPGSVYIRGGKKFVAK